MEKVRCFNRVVPYCSDHVLDELQRRERQGVYDTSDESVAQVHDAGLRANGVRQLFRPSCA